jgi:hypothetical protein
MSRLLAQFAESLYRVRVALARVEVLLPALALLDSTRGIR